MDSIRRIDPNQFKEPTQLTTVELLPISWLPTLDAFRTFAANAPAGVVLAAPPRTYAVAGGAA
jgi:hypothetical protein